MRGETSKCSLEFYVILSVTIENICKQITPAAKFAIRPAMANLHKFPDMNSRPKVHDIHNRSFHKHTTKQEISMQAFVCDFN